MIIASKQADKYKLKVFQSDVILRAVKRSGARPWYGIVFPAILILLLGIIAATEGSLSQHQFATASCHDLAMILQNPKWSCVRSYEPTAQFSLLRDIPSLIVVLVIGTEPLLIYKQWLGFEKLFPSMIRNGLIAARSGFENALLDEVKSSNRYFARVGRSGSLLSLLATLLVVPIFTAESSGLYPYFRSGQYTSSQWSSQTYKQWWASFDTHPVGWVAYSMILVVGVYAAILMNVVALRPTLTLWRVRHKLDVRASADNIDKYFGWAQPREILAAGYIATAIYGLSISCISLTLDGAARWAVFPFILQWLLVLPFHLYIPLAFVRSKISRYKREEEARLTGELNAIRADMSIGGERNRELIANRLARVRSIRALPFRSFKDVSAAIFLFAASIASIYAALGLWYQLT